MHILCIGVNHQTANVAIREQLAFTEEALQATLARLGCGRSKKNGKLPKQSRHTHNDPFSPILELVILSTCNRVELYAAGSQADPEPLYAFLEEVRHLSSAELRPHLYQHIDESAIEHLFHVAAGLDSLVLGEPQILGQVTQALEMARAQNTAGPILSRLFQAAIHTGKRVRTETAIAQNPSSVSAVAVRLAADVFPDLEDTHVAIVGAGEMATLVVESLRKRGVRDIYVVNRTLDRARQLAEQWQGEATTFENLSDVLKSADIVITSTGAPHTLIHPPTIQAVMQSRHQRPLFMIDIAVPRDIDPAVDQIPGVNLYDMDALQSFLSESLILRQVEVPDAQSILSEELDAFLDYMNTLDLLPLIRDLHLQAEQIRQDELEKTLRRLPELSEDDRQRIEALTQALVKKILHAPITRLRAEAGCSYAGEFTFVTRSLFNLTDQALDTAKTSDCYYTGGACIHSDAGATTPSTFTSPSL